MEAKNLNASTPEVVQPEIMDANTQEVVQPENNGAAAENPPTGEVTDPRTVDVESMTDDEFAEYINRAQNGEIAHVPAAQPAANNDAETAAGSENNSDNSGAAPPADDNTNEAQPFKVFNTQEEFQSEFDRIMGDRLKAHRADMDILSKLKTQARNFYTDAADDDAAVAELIADLQQQCADRQGIGIEEYKQNMQQAEDARRFREQQSMEAQQQARITEIQNRWRAESGSLKKVVPTFDFQKALENKTFYDAISAGESVHMAYMMANKQAEAQKPKPPTRKPIAQVAQQKGGIAGRTEFDPTKLSGEDFDSYIDRIQNG